MKPGGTEGGTASFLAAIGLFLSALALYLLFDSVHTRTVGRGMVSGAMGGGGGLIVFLPFIFGVVALFYNSKARWAWGLLWVGVGVIVVEVFSRIRLVMDLKLAHLMILLIMFSAGVGLMLRAFREDRQQSSDADQE